MAQQNVIRFKTFNPRRNLPPETGRKRGEANFLGAFERLLSLSIFGTGFGGRYFSFFNYGIADLVWVIPRKHGLMDSFSATLYAFETKLENWRRAFQQAYRYSYFSDTAFVVLPSEKGKHAIANLNLFQTHNIGLWLFNKKEAAIDRVFTPSGSRARNQSARQKAIETISAKVNFR